jgi:hypothetical protein
VSDILERLAACISGTVTPEDRDAITLEACAEIVRLRLTDEEREAIRNVLHHIATKADYLQREDYHLRSLLERTK